MSDRRTFLRGLASLPLIGGGVTLIGNPTAAAVPASRDLLQSYKSWLFMEHRMVSYELVGYRSDRRKDMELCHWPNSAGGLWHFQWQGRGPAGWIDAPQPSTRAAVILSAAGVPIGGHHG
ncbi:hypothetical protein [Lichenibacterium ramalinae]|uniref:Uncharacterized protein n=1 Tax=Lichenibacterium ramalinae TaxID=2316527 RepID=A0A4Q2RDE2_9HYPH|nr:hypothetical protein [Lichenibacterium ramalinae]RYB05735.1 hypothetical protein D3272_09125 [Lichenibacterium ramalinae]